MKGDIYLWRKKETRFPASWDSSLLQPVLQWAWVIFGDFHTWLQNMAEEFLSDSFPVWARVILVIVMLSVSLHINLSPADMRNALRGVPMYLGVALLIAVITSYASMPLTYSIIWYLKMLNAYMMAMFTIILVFALLQVLIALVIWLIKRIGR